MLSAAYCDNISNVPFTKECKLKITGYLINIIAFDMALSDHIKRLSLYKSYHSIQLELDA